jgi:tetratricopeptide (TPR) repeat protein
MSNFCHKPSFPTEGWTAGLGHYLIGFFVIIIVANCGHRQASYEIVELPVNHINQDEIFIPYLRQQISRQPNEPSNYLKLAGIYLNQSKFNEAKALLQNANSRQENNLEILAMLSKIYLSEKDTSSLRANVSRMRKLDPEYDGTLIFSAEYGLLTQQPDNAIYYANRAILKNPYNDNCRILLGKAYLMKRDSTTALQNFHQAFSMHSSNENFSNLFSLLLATGQFEESKALIAEFESEETSAQTCLEQAMYFNAVQQYDSARLSLDICRIEIPDEKTALFEWAKYYFATKNDSALQTVNLYLYHYPEDTRAIILKARMKSAAGATMEAIDLYTLALLSDSSSVIARTELENLEGKVAYLRLVKRKDETQKQLEIIKPLGAKQIN